jgi:hypothetical protein
MARSFNGSTDYIDCGASVPNATTAITTAAWVYVTSLVPAYQGIYSKSNYPNALNQILVKSSGKFAYYVVLVGIGLVGLDPGTNAISTGSWHHIAMTFDSADGFLRGYLDGVADGTTSAASGNNLGTTWGGVSTAIGNDLASAGRNFSGTIADAAQWNNVALTPSEIAALASGIRPYRIRRSALVGYWPLEGTASPEPDVIGGNNGTLTGTSLAANPFNYTTPKYGSRSFNGSSDSINMGQPSALNFTAPFTLSAWTNATSFPALGNNSGGIITKGYDGSKAQYVLRYTGSPFAGGNALKLQILYYDGAVHGIEWSPTNTTGTWYNIVGGFDGSVWFLYNNGISVGTTSGTQIAPTNSAEDFAVGSEVDTGTPAQFFNGLIADAAAWNVALSATEIAKLAAGYRPYQVRTSGLIGYWPLEGTASPEPDLVAGNNGTLTGTSAGASPTRYQDLVGA